MANTATEPEVGLVVAGKYRLTRMLGRGGMGSVWEGVHTTLGTRFALKYIDAAFAGRQDVQTRFANEALAAAKLRSKHIVDVYDHGTDQRGCAYIVMEFLSGESLEQRLVRERTLSLVDTAVVVLQVARALQKAHAAGIVHRDLKPDNVFLVWDEEDHCDVVKVVDFGIAKFTDGSGVAEATRTGAVLGTPHFMSPEQARGLKGVGPGADIWSLGVIAYRCVTGSLPFWGEAVGDLLVRICTETPRVPSSITAVPPAFDAWVERSLQKTPEARFATVEEQAQALRHIALSIDPSARIANVLPESQQASFRQPAAGEEAPDVVARSVNAASDTNKGVVRGVARRSGSKLGLLAVALIGLVAALGTVFSWMRESESAESAIPSPSIAMSPALSEGIGVAPEAKHRWREDAGKSSESSPTASGRSAETEATPSEASSEAAPAKNINASEPVPRQRIPAPPRAPRSPADELGY